MDVFDLRARISLDTSEYDRGLTDSASRTEGVVSRISNSFSKIGGAFSNVGKKLLPASAAIAGALGASVKGASNFNDGMAKMSTLFDTTKVPVGKLSQEFINLSNKLGLSADGLAEAGYQALSAGVDVKNSVGFVETAGKLAKAGFTSTATSVDVLTTAINAYGLKQTEAESIANKLVRTQNLGKTTVDELASSMGKIIPTASSMNVNIDNLTAGYAQLTKGGIATAESTTYMNSMMNELGEI
ncbi:Phage tail length tape-measure protein [Lachnospiraceae bacterium TWA4]|nr:Phage tail length tape-measure protein [Lachnospiraceae bacterium TWA4]